MADSTADKPTILVVDDSRLMRVAARKILKNDFEIIEAEDGEVAWDVLQSNPQINLVMSDLSMPNLDGLGLLKKIRESSEPHCRDLPVIIVTGAEDDDGSKTVALSAGASDFITKPFESVQLLARAQAQAKQQRTQQALQDSEASKQQLEEHSNIDPLTGLANQRAFNEAVEESLSYAIRHKTELAVLVVRVDKYKVLFLRRGKQTAEEVLRRIAQLLNAGRRREDTVARSGLDNFSILLPSANPIGARRVAEQLQLAIKEQDFTIDGEAVPVSVTIAVSSPPIHAHVDRTQLLADAEEKLKVGQQAGGDCIQHATPETTPQQPVEKPAAIEPEAVTVATGAEVHRALEALARGDTVEVSADALARAVLPILEAWDQSRENSHSALLAELRKALQPSGGTQPATPPAADTTAQSV
jgi:diguanylate cyclase (GGDEF)-like protein